MSRWFRVYDELLDDPKVQRLPAEDFKGWINLLCLASRNDGRIPPLEDVSFALRVTLDGARTLLERLRSGGLIVRKSGGVDGAYDAPHRWGERQYKSDTSTDRVKRFRERSRSGDETPSDTETDTETEDTPNGVSATGFWSKPPAPVSDQVWKDFKANRKRKRTPNTPTAYGKLENDLARISAQTGISPEKLLEYATQKGWAAVYVPDELKGRTNGAGNQSTDRTLAAAEGAFGPFSTWSDSEQF